MNDLTMLNDTIEIEDVELFASILGLIAAYIDGNLDPLESAERIAQWLDEQPLTLWNVQHLCAEILDDSPDASTTWQ